MLILKIPIVYLGLVVWYAIRAEPEPGVDPTSTPRGVRGDEPDGPRPAPRRPARHARHRPRRARASR